MEQFTEIQELYKMIPKSVCIKGCSKCCYDIIQVAPEEDERMGGYKWEGKCVFLVNDQCSIHDKRAFICRLFGTSKIMQCVGCTPEYYLTENETRELVSRYMKIFNTSINEDG